jgi:RNA recognition motif-containing protein
MDGQEHSCHSCGCSPHNPPVNLPCSSCHSTRGRGFGTVRFASKEDAEAACNKLNNTELEGRTITVRLDRFA